MFVGIEEHICDLPVPIWSFKVSTCALHVKLHYQWSELMLAFSRKSFLKEFTLPESDRLAIWLFSILRSDSYSLSFLFFLSSSSHSFKHFPLSAKFTRISRISFSPPLFMVSQSLYAFGSRTSCSEFPRSETYLLTCSNLNQDSS